MTKVHTPMGLICSYAVLALLAGVPGLAAQVSPMAQANAAAVVNSNTQFAVDLLKQVNATAGSDNIFFSPYSVSTALAMTYAGSRNKTQKQMADVLHFDMQDPSLLDGFAALLKQTKAAAGKNYKLDVANAVWADKSSHFDPAYTGLLDKYYGGGFNALDFINDTDGSRQKINQSVADSTEGKIQNLLGPKDVNKLTRLVLTSAIYFMGNWESPFKTENTADAPFTLRSGEKVTVPLMEQVERFPFLKQTGMTAVELPYAGNDLSLIAILPDGDIDKLANSLSLAKIQQIQKDMRSAKVDVYLPRFKFESRYSLGQTLSKMGMSDAFIAKKADFSGMDGKTDLNIGQVIHHATIEVNEVGSIAAAATAVTIMAATAMPPSRETIQLFRADRPFLFMILHKPTGSILFMGRMSNPSGASAAAPQAK